jgi:transcription antitermination protein NusB
MSGRHESRSWAVQFLFQRDFNQGDLREALDEFWKERKTAAKLRTFAEELIAGVETARPELDALLQKYAENWDVHRMGGVDRNAMRVALFEMLHRPDIPPVVSINEAVDLAKEFGGDESGRFVNGILDRARKDIDRPARTSADAPVPSPTPPS